MKWPIKKLSEICEIKNGATPKTSVKKYWSEDYFWATPKDLSVLRSPEIYNTRRKISKAGLDSCGTTLLPIDTILLSSRAPIGLVAINKVPIATNQGFKSLIPNSKLIKSKFLYHWLIGNKEKIKTMGVGATFKEISKEIVSKIEIPLPSLEKQKYIIKILDASTNLLLKHKQILNKLDKLEESFFF